jgi:hypothetical protein
MGCFGNDREKNVSAEHHWDYINLSDFKSTSCWAPFSYAILYISLLISVACYIVDIFTCSQLIIFDKWSGQIQPKIPFEIARWIFTGCILLSLVLLVWRWIRALRAIRSGGVANSYLDPLAVRVQSIRMGERGRGWRRFLVFAELTKSKKGAEYVALFAYFSFEASLRILLAEGPRQAINAMTLVSVMQSEIIPSGAHAAAAGHSPIIQFFINVKILAETDKIRAVVLFGMLFTLLIWIIAALGLATACILYIVFLWHHIPSDDGGLSGYCKRKIDGRLQKIVDVKVQKALEKEDKKRLKEEAKLAKSGESNQAVKRQPTVPVLDTKTEDKLPDMPLLTRQNTQATLPEYSSRPPTSQGNPMPGIQRQPTNQSLQSLQNDYARPFPSRTATQTSGRSYASSNAPLLTSAAPMGFDQPGRPYSPAQPSPIDPFAGSIPQLGRTLTGQSQSSQNSYGHGSRNPNQVRPMGPPRNNPNGSQLDRNQQFTPGPPSRQNTGMSDGRFTPGPPRRQNTGGTTENGSYFGGTEYPDNASIMSTASYGRRTPGAQNNYSNNQMYEMQPQPPRSEAKTPSQNGYQAYNPSSAQQRQNPTFTAPNRNFSSSVTPYAQDNYNNRPYPPPRSGTAPPMAAPYDDSIYDSYRGDDHDPPRPTMPTRSATTDPGNYQWQFGL